MQSLESSTQLLLQFFKEIISIEKIAICLKRELRSHPNYNPFNLVASISPQYPISISAFKTFLSNKMAINDRQIYDIFERIDHCRQGFLTSDSIQKEFGPGKTTNNTSSEAAIGVFLRLISVWVRGCRVLDTWRSKLQGQPPYHMFSMLNFSITGNISIYELNDFFRKQKQPLTHEDSFILYRSLLRGHRKLTIEVFCENLQPLQFGYYSSFQKSLEDQFNSALYEREEIARKAAEKQDDYLKDRKAEELVREVHHEAAVWRQKELQRRVCDELQVYRQLKFLTKKKYHPELKQEEQFMKEQKMIEESILQEKKAVIQAEVRRRQYDSKMRNLQVLREVEQIESRPQRSRQQLESMIRRRTLAARKLEPILRNGCEQGLMNAVPILP